MVRIDTIKDIEDSSLDDRIKCYVKRRLKTLLEVYETDNIQDYGSIFVLENCSDFEQYRAMGLSHPLTETTYETVTSVQILGNRQVLKLLVGCIAFNNDFAIDILIHQSDII